MKKIIISLIIIILVSILIFTTYGLVEKKNDANNYCIDNGYEKAMPYYGDFICKRYYYSKNEIGGGYIYSKAFRYEDINREIKYDDCDETYIEVLTSENYNNSFKVIKCVDTGLTIDVIKIIGE